MSFPTLNSIRTENPTAGQLVLSFLNIPEFETCEVSSLVKLAGNFDIDEAALRVALGRLVKRELVHSVSRGVYSIGPQGKTIMVSAQDWKSVDHKVRSWDGSWIIVHTAHLGRTNKTRLRARERAFRLRGFASLVKGVWIRPANLKESMRDTRDYLISLGLEEEAIFSRATELSGVPEAELKTLWPAQEIEKGYHNLTGYLEQSEREIPAMDDRRKAREYMLLGNAVIRQINIDPLLPAELIDVEARKQLVDKMVSYNSIGVPFWQRYIN